MPDYSSGRTGITPAYAGNTSAPLNFWHFNWDHPRLRGEHTYYHICRKGRQGSPPPTRGTLASIWFRSDTVGITPAYAGNTEGEQTGVSTEKDHPRLRGEHDVPQKEYFEELGSPPPTRGTPIVLRF